MFQNSRFLRFLCARLLATLAAQMQGVAVGWQVYEASGQLLDLGLIGLAQFAPFIVCVLPAGEAADRFDRRRTIMVCYALQLCSALGLLVLAQKPDVHVLGIFGVLVLQGVARAFIMPAQQAILINIVPVSDFGRAVAINSSTFHVAVVVGPTLGGLLYVTGPSLVYGLAAGLLVCAFVAMGTLDVTSQLRSERRLSAASLLEGLRFVRREPLVFGAMSLDLFAVLLGGAVGLLPAYARDILHSDPSGLGLLRTAPGVGAACASMALSVRPIVRNVGAWMFGGVAIFGVATLVLGFTAHAGVAFGALFLTGFGDMLSVYVRHNLVQLATPDDIRGRVSAVNAVFISASNELGMFESGLTAAWLGVIPAVLLGGGATLLVALGWWLLFPSLARLDVFPQPPARAPSASA